MVKNVSPDEIFKNFRSLNLRKTGDFCGISIKVFDTITPNVAPYIALIFNNCVESGTYRILKEKLSMQFS